jgi:hypothetical protein
MHHEKSGEFRKMLAQEQGGLRAQFLFNIKNLRQQINKLEDRLAEREKSAEIIDLPSWRRGGAA